MDARARSLAAVLLALLVATSAFAQTKATTNKTKAAPKDHKFSGKVVSASQSSFTIKHGKKTLTVETAGASATRDKKPFDLSQIAAGQRVIVYGVASGSEVMAHKVMVAKGRAEAMKSKTTATSHAKRTSDKGSYGSSGGAFHGIGW